MKSLQYALELEVGAVGLLDCIELNPSSPPLAHSSRPIFPVVSVLPPPLLIGLQDALHHPTSAPTTSFLADSGSRSTS